jgi:ABC-type lipoprotein release transport system permease subunit
VLTTFLFETTPQDPVTFVAAGVVLVVAALGATWWPARRAALIDPVTALRAE